MKRALGLAAGMAAVLATAASAQDLFGLGIDPAATPSASLPAAVAPAPGFAAGTRRNLLTLDDAYRGRLRQALLRMKERNVYDRFVTMHHGVMNTAHGVPAFLAWHRAAIREFEKELQREDAGLSLPYWDFTAPDPDSRVWHDDFLGGAGQAVLNWTGADGQAKTWTLRRGPFSPRQALVPNHRLDQTTFSDFRVELEGPLHNSAHVAVGGDVGNAMTAPRDPFFFFLHANVDRLWWEWQEARRQRWEAANAGQDYYTVRANDEYDDEGLGTSEWQGIDQAMWPFNGQALPSGVSMDGAEMPALAPWSQRPVTYSPRSVLDARRLGYSYEPTTSPPPPAERSGLKGTPGGPGDAGDPGTVGGPPQ